MIFEAGMITLIRTILIIALIYYGVKLIIKFLFPILIKKFIQKQQSKYHNPNSDTTSNSTEGNGSTNLSQKPQKDKLGDYVEYEEID